MSAICSPFDIYKQGGALPPEREDHKTPLHTPPFPAHVWKWDWVHFLTSIGVEEERSHIRTSAMTKYLRSSCFPSSSPKNRCQSRLISLIPVSHLHIFYHFVQSILDPFFFFLLYFTWNPTFYLLEVGDLKKLQFNIHSGFHKCLVSTIRKY